LIVLNNEILLLDDYPENVLDEYSIKKGNYANCHFNTKEYFEFFKFQLKKFKRREDINLQFNNKTFDFNNSRIKNNKTNFNINDVSGDTIEHDFSILNKMIIKPNNPFKKNDYNDNNVIKKIVNNLSEKKENKKEFFSNNVNQLQLKSNTACVDSIKKLSYGKTNKLTENVFRSDNDLSESYNLLNKKINSEFKLDNNISLKNNTYSEIECKNFTIDNCFLYTFFINNKLIINNISLNFKNYKFEESKSCSFKVEIDIDKYFSQRIEEIHKIIKSKKIPKKFLDCGLKIFKLYEKFYQSKDLIFINKLYNNSTDDIFEHLSEIINNKKNRKKEKTCCFNKINDFQYLYNPNSYEIRRINLNTLDEKELFFSFLNLSKEKIENIISIVLSEIYLSKLPEKSQEIVESKDEDLIKKFSNPNFLFSYLEIFGITSNNKIIGVIRNKAFFSLNIENKEIKFNSILFLENYNVEDFNNHNNFKNPKIEIQLDYDKKFYYFNLEENFNSDYFKLFTYNIDFNKLDIIKCSFDKNIPRFYFQHILNECINCFFVYISTKSFNYLYSSDEDFESNSNYDGSGDFLDNLFLVFMTKNKIVKFKLDLEEFKVEFYSEKIIREEMLKNIKPREYYSNIKNYDYYILFLNEDLQLIMYNFITNDIKILKEFI